MPKVTVSMGVNVPLTANAKFERFIPVVQISDVDTEGNVSAQIKAGLETAAESWTAISDFLEEHVKFETLSEIELPAK